MMDRGHELCGVWVAEPGKASTPAHPVRWVLGVYIADEQPPWVVYSRFDDHGTRTCVAESFRRWARRYHARKANELHAAGG